MALIVYILSLILASFITYLVLDKKQKDAINSLTVHYKTVIENMAASIESLEKKTGCKPNKQFSYPTRFSSSKQKKKNERYSLQGYNLNRSFAMWTPEEDKALIHRAKVSRMSIIDLAKTHQRSITAISARLKHLRIKYYG